MKYDYSVKANGKWYKPGEEVPDSTKTETAVTVADILDTETSEPDKKHSKKKN